jgi:hypothetical protein
MKIYTRNIRLYKKEINRETCYILGSYDNEKKLLQGVIVSKSTGLYPSLYGKRSIEYGHWRSAKLVSDEVKVKFFSEQLYLTRDSKLIIGKFFVDLGTRIIYDMGGEHLQENKDKNFRQISNRTEIVLKNTL